MKNYKIQNVATNQFLSKKGVWTANGSIWLNYPSEMVRISLRDVDSINVISYKSVVDQIKLITNGTSNENR